MRTVGLSIIDVRSVGSKGKAQSTTGGVAIMLQESKNKRRRTRHSACTDGEKAVYRLKHF